MKYLLLIVNAGNYFLVGRVEDHIFGVAGADSIEEIEGQFKEVISNNPNGSALLKSIDPRILGVADIDPKSFLEKYAVDINHADLISSGNLFEQFETEAMEVKPKILELQVKETYKDAYGVSASEANPIDPIEDFLKSLF